MNNRPETPPEEWTEEPSVQPYDDLTYTQERSNAHIASNTLPLMESIKATVLSTLNRQGNTLHIEFEPRLRCELSTLICIEVEATILNTLCRAQFYDYEEVGMVLKVLVAKGQKRSSPVIR